MQLLRALFFVAMVCLGALDVMAAPAVRTLYLVRHGFYDPVKGADEKTAMGLNPVGREQAAFVGARLAALPVKFDTFVSSELTRARETGDLIGEKLGRACSRDGRLNETTPPGAGLKAEQIDAGAEAQLDAAWKHYAVPADGAPASDLLVCHGNVIRWFVCRALGVDVQQWTRLEIANCSITIIQVRADGTTRLQQFNEIAHVPVEKQTWSGKGPGWPLPAQPRGK